MKKFLVALFFTLVLAGCGGDDSGDDNQFTGNENCGFDVSSFVNGPNSPNTKTFWDCTIDGTSQAFTFYSDGTGFLQYGGAFTWKQTGCREVEYKNGFGIGVASGINGSTSSGILTFSDKFEGETSNASCILKKL